MLSRAARVHLALTATSLIYGYFYVAVKILLQTIEPTQFILLRFVLTVMVVLVVNQFFFKHPLPDKKDLYKICCQGLLGVFTVQVLMAVSLAHTTAFHTALIMATIPILTLVASILKGQENFQLQKALGIAIAFIGVTVLVFFSDNPNSTHPTSYILGDGLVFLAALAFSWFLVGSKPLLAKYQSFPFMGYGYIVSALLYMALYFGEYQLQDGNLHLDFLSRLGPTQWLLLTFSVLFASIGTYTLNNFALKHSTPSMVAVYIFLQPVISAITGFYLLGETFNLEMAAATALTFLGVVVATAGQNNPASSVEVTETSLPAALPSAEQSVEVADVE